MQQEELLENGEIMLEKVRKHWIVYVEDFILHTFGCVLFLIIAHYLTSKSASLGALWGNYAGMILVMFVILFWVSFFYAWTKDYFDVWYVTDKHIIAVDQKQLLEREESFMEFSRIQDISFEKNGFVATFFGYGDLKVQSAGVEQEFIMKDVYNVESTAHAIMQLRDKTKHNEVSL